MPGNVTRLPFWAAVNNVALGGFPNEAWRNLTTSFVFGKSYTLIAVSVTSMFWLIVVSSVTDTIHNPLSSHRPWRAGGAIEEMLLSLAWKTFTPSCPGKNNYSCVSIVFQRGHALECSLAHSWDNYCLPGTLGEGAGLEQRSIGHWKLGSIGSDNNFIGWSGELHSSS